MCLGEPTEFLFFNKEEIYFSGQVQNKMVIMEITKKIQSRNLQI